MGLGWVTSYASQEFDLGRRAGGADHVVDPVGGIGESPRWFRYLDGSSIQLIEPKVRIYASRRVPIAWIMVGLLPGRVNLQMSLSGLRGSCFRFVGILTYPTTIAKSVSANCDMLALQGICVLLKWRRNRHAVMAGKYRHIPNVAAKLLNATQANPEIVNGSVDELFKNVKCRASLSASANAALEADRSQFNWDRHSRLIRTIPSRREPIRFMWQSGSRIGCREPWYGRRVLQCV